LKVVADVAHPENLSWNNHLEILAQDAADNCELYKGSDKYFSFGLFVQNPEKEEIKDLLTTMYFQS
jgi:hypothetical protein